jgi:hypothetical protein
VKKLGRMRKRYDDNVKMDFREMGSKNVKYI